MHLPAGPQASPSLVIIFRARAPLNHVARWSALPRDILGLCLRYLSEDISSSSGEPGISLRAVQQKLGGVLGACREWRAAALDEVAGCRSAFGPALQSAAAATDCAARDSSSASPATLCVQVAVCLGLDEEADMNHSLLLQLRCRTLQLPTDCNPGAVAGLLAHPRFIQRSSSSLEALTNFSPGAVSLAAFPSLRHLGLTPHSRLGSAAAAEGVKRAIASCASLRSVQLPFWRAGHDWGAYVPPQLPHAIFAFDQHVCIAAGMLNACHAVTARGVGTATLQLAAMAEATACREVTVEASRATLHIPNAPPHRLSVLHRMAAFHCTIASQAGTQSSTLSNLLRVWLAILAPFLTRSSIERVTIASPRISLYTYRTGELAALPIPRWQEATSQRVEFDGFAADLAWPAPGLPPAYFSLCISRVQDG